MTPLRELLEASAALHRHLCPRQVLGVRMGLLAGELFGLALPQSDKRLLAIIETDGCVIDGIAAATHCTVGRRTMRIEDYGKVAATFVDTHAEQAVRIVPRPEARMLAGRCTPGARNRWNAQLLGYQLMPAEELFTVQTVRLKTPIEKLVSQPSRRAVCEICGEEIINQREVTRGGRVLCRACAGQTYYRPAMPESDRSMPVSITPAGSLGILMP